MPMIAEGEPADFTVGEEDTQGPPQKSARTGESCEVTCLAVRDPMTLVMEVESQIQKGVAEASQDLHESLVFGSAEEKPCGTTELEAKQMELQGLQRMGVFVEATREECEENTGTRPVSGLWLMGERDHKGSGKHKARFAALGLRNP